MIIFHCYAKTLAGELNLDLKANHLNIGQDQLNIAVTMHELTKYW